MSATFLQYRNLLYHNSSVTSCSRVMSFCSRKKHSIMGNMEEDENKVVVVYCFIVCENSNINIANRTFET